MATRQVTIKDVAEKADVSTAVVSYVINERPVVAPSTREKVLRVAGELGYHPNIVGRGLALGRSLNIGVGLYSVDYLVQPYFALIIAGIAHQVGLNNYRMQFVVTDCSRTDALGRLCFTKAVREGSLDGLVIIDQCIPDAELLWLRDRGVPFVLVDRFIRGERVGSVRVDNLKGIFIATEHLISLGHRRIGLLVDSLDSNKYLEMYEGYKAALARYGLPLDRRLVSFWKESVREKHSDDKQRAAEEALLGLHERPTAIVCSSDMNAVPLLRIIQEHGLSVPGDIAVVGYNDDPHYAHVQPQLTTVRIPLEKLGEESVKMLVKLMDTEETPVETVLDPVLVVRESSGGPLVGVKNATQDASIGPG